MTYLLDTCFLSEFVKPSPLPAVIEWGAAQDETDLYISVLTLGEVQKGVTCLASSRRKTDLQRWLERFLNSTRFDATMMKYPKWAEGDQPVVFP